MALSSGFFCILTDEPMNGNGNVSRQHVQKENSIWSEVLVGVVSFFTITNDVILMGYMKKLRAR